MATETLPLGSMLGGAIVAEMDRNTANNRISQIRVINNHPSLSLHIEVSELGAVIFSTTAPPNQTTSWNTTGIQIEQQPDYWNSETQQYEPDGIEMGDYVISVRAV